MSIWTDIGDFLGTTVPAAFTQVVEQVRTAFVGDPETRRKVSFSVAIIALSAKMAKADGVVTQDEVSAFREIFAVPDHELDNVSRLYNLAKQDVAGFHSYANQVRSLFPGDDPTDADILTDVLDALFHIAKADTFIHENELLFLEDISVIFGFDAAAFEGLKARHMLNAADNPYRVLGVEPDLSYDELKTAYRQRLRDNHPDKLIARGVPPEFVAIANERMAAMNVAWETIEKLHRPETPDAKSTQATEAS
ncbi:DnaJ family molecular chaperone [Ahrensia sp. R2A130]|uniref:J domain-containing protein n=1 Tax=Ahrensia sp. R2A130 TaxID=744979 RepID=UPI0001E0D0B5|nr:DnaJ family molecular chaperone [Ahrensia sp. R2A130]EFL90854.1 heat shock protein DnaJ domain-containing protein [Ahrensia sp. R2A130]